MKTLVRIDTEHYGWIVSQHRTAEAAEKAQSKADARVLRKNRNALVHLMFRVVNVPRGKRGDRVRI